MLTKEQKIEKRLKLLAEIRAEIAKQQANGFTVPEKYDVVVLDPPWAFEEKAAGGCDEYDPDTNRGVIPYPSMSLEEIKAIQLPIKDDAVVFLWTVHAFLHDSFHLLESWGLTYRKMITWDKMLMGMGRFIRLQCEFCLIATKGKPFIQGEAVRDIITEERREHSRKPEKFYRLVEKMTVGLRLDYFSRQQRAGWGSLGIEQDKFEKVIENPFYG